MHNIESLAMLDHLVELCRVALRLDRTKLVFGDDNNLMREQLTDAEAAQVTYNTTTISTGENGGTWTNWTVEFSDVGEAGRGLLYLTGAWPDDHDAMETRTMRHFVGVAKTWLAES